MPIINVSPLSGDLHSGRGLCDGQTGPQDPALCLCSLHDDLNLTPGYFIPLSVNKVITIFIAGMYFYIADTVHDASLAHKLSVLPVVSLSLFVSMFSIGKNKHQRFYILYLCSNRFWSDSLAHDVRALLSRGEQ